MGWYTSWFDSPYYHALYAHRDHREASAFIARLLAYLHLPVDAQILDLACGNGRHSHVMAQMKYRVTGIDLSHRNIEEAKKSGISNARFVQGDMREVFQKNQFDLVVNLFTSFGYFENENDNLRVLKSACANLKDNGIFVLDFLSREYTENHLVARESTRIDELVINITRRIENENIIKEIEIQSSENNFSFEEIVRGFRKDQLQRLLREAGFEVLAIFGNYELQPFECEKSERCILINRKKSFTV